MSEIITQSGRHVWVEILAGSPQAHQEAYYCVKCGARSRTGWSGPGPENSVCSAGHRVIDPSIVHRQPERPWWVTPTPPSSEVAILRPLPSPAYLLGVDEAEGFSPVSFHPTRPGFVLARDHRDAEATARALGRTGWRLLANQTIAIIRLPSQPLDTLAGLAERTETPVYGVYWDLKDRQGRMAYLFRPFERAAHA